jgi:hypothetical protein
VGRPLDFKDSLIVKVIKLIGNLSAEEKRAGLKGF